MTWMSPVRLVALSAATTSGPGGSAAEKSSSRWMPALLTSVVRCGCTEATSASPRVTDCGSVTSMTTTDIPWCRAATDSSRARSRPEIITRDPRAWKRAARPAPMPELPPVTRTTSSCDRWSMVCLLVEFGARREVRPVRRLARAERAGSLAQDGPLRAGQAHSKPAGRIPSRLPSRATSAGASKARTTKASQVTPRAGAVARIVTSPARTVDSATKDRNRMSAAEVTSRPVCAIPSTTARPVSPCWWWASRMPDRTKTSACTDSPNRTANAAIGTHTVIAPLAPLPNSSSGPDALLPAEDGDPVRGGERDHVQQQRLDRRPQRAGQRQDGHHEDRDDGVRGVGVDGPDEVRLCGSAAGSTSVRCRHTHRVRPCTPTALP